MAFRNVTFLLLITIIAHLVLCHEKQNPLSGDDGVHAHQHHIRSDDHMQQGGHHMDQDPVGLKFDEKVIHDKEHISSHLDGVVKPDENASDDELEFYYFKLHDYNQDDHLDGLELLKSFQHEHKKEESPETSMHADVDNIIDTVDDILASHDKDNDGRLSYMEYHRITSNQSP